MSDHPASSNEFVNPLVQYEPTDLRLRPILAFIAGLIAIIALVAGGLWLLMTALVGPPAPSKSIALDQRRPWQGSASEALDAPPVQQSRLPPRPALEEIDQQTPASEGGPKYTRPIQQQVKEEEDWLKSYGWVDENKNIVHIPIKTAMERLAGKPGGTP